MSAGVEDALVQCRDCDRATALQEDPAAMCPRCGGFQTVV